MKGLIGHVTEWTCVGLFPTHYGTPQRGNLS